MIEVREVYMYTDPTALGWDCEGMGDATRVMNRVVATYYVETETEALEKYKQENPVLRNEQIFSYEGKHWFSWCEKSYRAIKVA